MRNRFSFTRIDESWQLKVAFSRRTDRARLDSATLRVRRGRDRMRPDKKIPKIYQDEIILQRHKMFTCFREQCNRMGQTVFRKPIWKTFSRKHDKCNNSMIECLCKKIWSKSIFICQGRRYIHCCIACKRGHFLLQTRLLSRAFITVPDIDCYFYIWYRLV